ncbi:hypothetical protein BCV70DRAFT_200833 [Testicularia cyperi]|uniref:Conserved oligomeric Golgi complex subunit 7 n=1 Tax=Testicularia cyperi TaxID=1882483 RepID=A0A317XLQ0_9BASI|nr:hypothetical protein BCV70DRAFT_200833 [Testicularia cyperi]
MSLVPPTSSPAKVPLSSVHRLQRASGNPSRRLSCWLDEELSSAVQGASADKRLSEDDAHHSTSPQSTLQLAQLDTAAHALRQISIQLASARESNRTDVQNIIHSLVSTIPSMAIELNLMAESAKTLEARIHSLSPSSTPAQAAQQDVDVALATISTLARTKAGMIAARHTLREAQAWSTLEAEVASLLAEQRLEEAVSRLVKASDSLKILSGSTSTNQEQRQSLLARLTHDIEQHLTPVLCSALLDRDVHASVQIAHLFVRLGSVDAAFMHVYMSTRTQRVLQQWNKRHAADADRKELATQLTSLFGDALALLGEERVFAPKIFADPRTSAEMLLAYIFTKLSPSLALVIGQSGEHVSTEQFLGSLTDAWKTAEEALGSFSDLLPVSSSPSADTKEFPPITHFTLSDLPLASWQYSFLQPFLPYQTRLPELEAEAMQIRYQQSLSRPSNLPSTTVSFAPLQAVEVAKHALKRSAILTKNFATAPLLPSLEDLLVSVIDRLCRDEEFQGEASLSQIKDRIVRSHMINGASGGHHTSLTFDERGESLTASDWEEFRKATEKLTSCRDILQSLCNLEQNIALSLSELRTSSLPDRNASDQDVKSPLQALCASSLNTKPLQDAIILSKLVASGQTSGQDRMLIMTGQLGHREQKGRLLPRAIKSLLSVGQAIQRFQHNLILTPFLPELESYSKLRVWTSTTHPGVTNEFDLAMPKFSLSPTEEMARIGEGLLNLPRLFEGYADEPLLFCLPSRGASVAPGAASDSEREPGAETSSRSAQHRQAFSISSVPAPIAVNVPPLADLEKDKDNILSIYLHSIMSEFFRYLLATTLPNLPRCTEIGVSQLSADLEYLSNIASVIYSDAEQVLKNWKKAAEMPRDFGIALLGSAESLPAIEGWTEQEVRALASSDALRSMSRIRGWV